MKTRGELNTEKRNPLSKMIDSMSVTDILKTINKEDAKVSKAVEIAIPEIESTIQFTVDSIKNGGRVFYIGAGTSGRLGVLDASEIPPTYSLSENYFIGIIAGGDDALRHSIEGVEDQIEEAIEDLQHFNINKSDTVIGISCSGAANYVISALDYARNNNAKTVYLVTNPNPFKITKVDIIIHANTGPEVITGSTRMKAGTATKLILNMISTTTMIKLGKVYGNLMVDLKTVNDKLIDRGTRIILELTDLKYNEAKTKLLSAEKSVKVALVMELLNCSLSEAKEKLKNVDGFLHRLIDLDK
ncbi:MAG: N-acetylmuramic acid 6-phosphate etherase [Candidatus Marinimicrobia bacterium]|nr:N-acetylmuramic acid 6-phosphate etherase [Candidatus Neomarinimicrobiota bacterium]|tara:strand:- start:2144 stop:3046 length:903 start_codon:yes stop_codon:yes gene_type:complete